MSSMPPPAMAVDALDWTQIASLLDSEGHAVLPGLFSSLQSLAGDADHLRPVSLAAARLGRGELFYYGDKLPQPLRDLRQARYPNWTIATQPPCAPSCNATARLAKRMH